ncbi:MAG: tryptophanase [Anaerovoracaceae bacterium]|jgi:tryptophanase
MSMIKLTNGNSIPLEMHKVRIVQQLNLPSHEDRLNAITEAGNNTFLLKNRDIFLDMLTDSGVNAMSDKQLSAMMVADDSYAGSETFFRLEAALNKMFGKDYFLPAHQGRACEHIIAKSFVKPGQATLMNYHFTTTKSHICLVGGSVIEIPTAEAFNLRSSFEFKGNMDLEKLKKNITDLGAENIAFVRMEAGTNLIGGQPFSLENMREVHKICSSNGIMLILDASLLADNLHFIKVREQNCSNMSINEISLELGSMADIVYFSGRKLGSARGGGICTSNKTLFKKMQGLIPLYEGFLTYGGMSVREMEAMAVGIDETMDENMVSQGPQFIEFMVSELQKRSIPVVTPAGGLGCHLNAMEFLSHIPQTEYPAGALAVALYIVSGIRGMERGTMSEQRDENGVEPLANMELLRLAMPRRVFTMSQILYAVDRIEWLYKNRDLIGGLKWEEEPEILRFFFGRLKPIGDWQTQLLNQYKKDFCS